MKMPDLTGKTIREVTELCDALQIHLTGNEGSGFVISQSIAAGTVIKAGSQLVVKLSP